MSRGSSGELCASVAVPIPSRKLFAYSVPDSIKTAVRPGVRVIVPFGPRKVTGTVVEFPAPPPPDVQVKPIAGVVEDGPSLEPEILDLTRFVADYYLCSWGDSIEAALPPAPPVSMRRKEVCRKPGVRTEDLPHRAIAQRRVLELLPADGSPVPMSSLSVADRAIARRLVKGGFANFVESSIRAGRQAATEETSPDKDLIVPTPEQARALDEILPAVDSARYAPFLLHGVTGSGKTEVYLRAAEATLQVGKGVLYLVPEIGLTPLLMSRLRRRFTAGLEVLHSGLSGRERHDAWMRVREGAGRFVVGTRSAVFAPVRNLGLVVVDEEHDGSYKQEETPRYNGRDLAVYRGRESEAVVLLGSATPSLESYQHCIAGRYRLLHLPTRVMERVLPDVEVVDMRLEFRSEREVRPLSGTLVTALRECLDRGEQALVLRNRRGWSVSVFCPACGNRVQCTHCSLTLTYHRGADRMRCHACMRESVTPRSCPVCRSDELRFMGEGAERVEDELEQALPGARIVRMDRDTVRGKGMHEKILRRFENREIDVLVGTQMIAKGHDFPGVTLVGVLSADQSLGLPDFRAAERTFQLLTQVAGRSGRGESPGKVILQAFETRHRVLRDAVLQNYEGFFEREVEYRRTLRYPPFSAMIRILVRDRNPVKAATWAGIVAEAVRRAGKGRLMVAGPGPAPVERMKDRYRQQILVRSAGRRRMVNLVEAAIESVIGEVPEKAMVVDVDPYSLL